MIASSVKISMLVFALLGVAVALKLFVGFALINSALLVAGLVFIGHLVTFDEDLPGGWSNPFGTEPTLFGVLAAKGIIFLALLAAKFLIVG